MYISEMQILDNHKHFKVVTICIYVVHIADRTI